jgi:D-beta-D-heptose 7-phosphate kinase/D-beta-D-heptose 1-phosphate adenosyltransferase
MQGVFEMKRRIVTVAISGAFDPIHVGHIRHIREAAKLGDRLVVILNSDDFLLRKKGVVFRPFEDRKEILENIKGVDEVIASIDKDQTVSETLELVKPNIFAKGGDRTGPENIPEAKTCHKIGCKLVTDVGGSKIRSDSYLSLKVKELEMEDTSRLRITCPYCDDHPILREKCLYCKGLGKLSVEKADEKKRSKGMVSGTTPL